MSDDKKKSSKAPNSEYVFYHSSAPTDYDPRDFGLRDETVIAQISDLRGAFQRREFENLINMANHPETTGLVAVATKLYGAMATREFKGDHWHSHQLLCEALLLIRELPENERMIEYTRRLEVNVLSQVAICLAALSGNYFLAKSVAGAVASQLAIDGRMGNWSSWVNAAEYTISNDAVRGVPEQDTMLAVHRILLDLKTKHPDFFADANLQSYLSNAIFFEKYRSSPLYRELINRTT